MGADTKSSDAVAAFKKRLTHNPTVTAQKVDSYAKERFPGILIGNDRGIHLVIGGFNQDCFGVGERIILRMALGSELVGFTCNVLAKTDTPLMYVVDFPDDFETIQLRKSGRVQAFFPAEISFRKESPDAHILVTRILDISAGGCCFRSKTQIPAKSEVKISFTLPGDRQIQSVNAIVIVSEVVGKVFNNRATFSREGTNIPIVQEITKWVNESMSYA